MSTFSATASCSADVAQNARLAASHIVHHAKLYMAPSEYERMLELLQAYDNSVIHKPVAEYLLMDMMRVHDDLFRDVAQFILWCNWMQTIALYEPHTIC